jgi:hypothetical protein
VRVLQADLRTRVEPGQPVEREVAFDMSRRALFLVPIAVGFGAAFWGLHGALSAVFGLALAVANLVLAAVILSWAARVSLVAMAAAALGGYLVRLGLLTAAVFAVRHQHWVAWVPLAFTLIVTHLALLIWETRYVSASLAYPGLKPTKRP